MTGQPDSPDIVGAGRARAEQIAAIITANRYVYRDEKQLHEGIAAALTAHGHRVAREVALTNRDRIDLLVDRIGVEVKVGGQPAAVARQLQRYAHSDQLDALILVTNRARHTQLPSILAGTPVVIASLLGGF
jgi:hypothetical protein